MKNQVRHNLMVFAKAGLPFTIAGMIIVFAGIYGLKRLFLDSDYLVAILFVWLALFWTIYQPLFKNRILKVKNSMESR